MQYVSVKFNAWDRRSFTYHNAGERLAPGDKVIVETKDGDQTVTVESVDVPKPGAFQTKPIKRKAPAPALKHGLPREAEEVAMREPALEPRHPFDLES